MDGGAACDRTIVALASIPLSVMRPHSLAQVFVENAASSRWLLWQQQLCLTRQQALATWEEAMSGITADKANRSARQTEAASRIRRSSR
jgi:hypothetical protein